MFEVINFFIQLGNSIGAPIRAAAEQFDSEGNLIDRDKAKRTAIIGGLFSPSKALKARQDSGCWGDLTGNCYADWLEENEKARLQALSDQQRAIEEEERRKQEQLKKVALISGLIVAFIIVLLMFRSLLKDY